MIRLLGELLCLDELVKGHSHARQKDAIFQNDAIKNFNFGRNKFKNLKWKKCQVKFAKSASENGVL
jgi:hypothetical protein